jgi:hypothetical protein
MVLPYLKGSLYILVSIIVWMHFIILKLSVYLLYLLSTKVHYKWYQSSFLGKKVEEFFFLADFSREKRGL